MILRQRATVNRFFPIPEGVQPQWAGKLAEHIGEDTLTAREVEVVNLVAGGNRNRDIGAPLCIAEETVKVHLKHIRAKRENIELRDEVDRASMFEEIVGTSSPLKAVLSRIAKVAPTDSTVLITGET